MSGMRFSAVTCDGRKTGARRGFSLIELLVVVAILALLAAVLVPGLAKARGAARAGVCASNIRQIAFANVGYSGENKDYCVAAAPDIFDGFGGRRRWHGVRQSPAVSADPGQNRFDPAQGPLVKYLTRDGKAKECPGFRDFITDGSQNAFEAGGGGYGYNGVYVGGRYDLFGASPEGARATAQTTAIRSPARTVMFADTAFAQSNLNPRLLEYSFCEPPRLQDEQGAASSQRTTPSIHFRHGGRAEVAWADGHVDAQHLGFSWHPLVKLRPAIRALSLGWFGPASNTLFDLN